MLFGPGFPVTEAQYDNAENTMRLSFTVPRPVDHIDLHLFVDEAGRLTTHGAAHDSNADQRQVRDATESV